MRSARLFLLCGVTVPAQAALTKEQQTAVMDHHNSLRSKQSVPCTASDMRKLTWDDELAKVAQAYAEKCVWEHNPNVDAQTGYPTGENLYAAVGDHPAVHGKDFAVAGTQSWYDEIAGYDFSTGACDLKKVPMCGHYTQVVWSASTTIGCGSHMCKKEDGSNGLAKASQLAVRAEDNIPTCLHNWLPYRHTGRSQLSCARL
jgi:uncharacterized protein YkwD